MTKLFKKFFIATLSFVMMIACAFTFTTYKASASTNDNNTGISADTISAFTQDSIDDIEFGEDGDPLCFLLDHQLFTSATNSISITSNTTLSDINDSPVIQTMAKDFAEKLGITISDPDAIIDAESIFDLINMNIIIHVSNRAYRNVTTGVYSNNINTYSALSNWNNYVTGSTVIYAMIVFEPVTTFYNLLTSVQNGHLGSMYAYALDYDGVGNNGSLNVTIV